MTHFFCFLVRNSKMSHLFHKLFRLAFSSLLVLFLQFSKCIFQSLLLQMKILNIMNPFIKVLTDGALLIMYPSLEKHSWFQINNLMEMFIFCIHTTQFQLHSSIYQQEGGVVFGHFSLQWFIYPVPSQYLISAWNWVYK